MDKYDELEESARDFEAEYYFASLDPLYDDIEAQKKECWKLKELDKFGSQV